MSDSADDGIVAAKQGYLFKVTSFRNLALIFFLWFCRNRRRS